MSRDYDYLEVVETPAIGLAVICRRDFRKGEVVFSFADATPLAEQTQHSLQLRPGVFVEHPIAGYVQHACDPNCWVATDRLEFICRIDIRSGDALQMDYEQTEDLLFKAFDCHCGSPVCRGWISGRRVVDRLSSVGAK